MEIFDRIEEVAITQKVQEAFLDLAGLMLFADRKSKLIEQGFIKALLRMQKSGELDAYYQQLMSKINHKSFNPAHLLEETNAKFADRAQREVARDFIREFMIADKELSAKEESLYKKMRFIFEA